MRNSKKIILIIIIILSVVLILGGGAFAYAYFFTDVFKTEQQLFYKYIAKNSEIIEFLNDEKIRENNEKVKSTSYKNNGEISLSLSGNIDEDIKLMVDEIQKHKITYTGNVNTNNNYFDQEIKLMYGENEVIGSTLIHKDDYYGAELNVAKGRYITIENNNLKEFAKKLGLTEEQIAEIPDKINLENIQNETISKEELKEISNRYLKVVTDNLTPDLFSKNKTEDGYVYTLTINEQTAKTVLNALIETLKNDNQILDKLKEVYKAQNSLTDEETEQAISQFKQTLENAQNSLNEGSNETTLEDNTVALPQTENSENEDVYINVYVSKRKLTKTEIEVQNEGKIVLTNGESKISFDILKSNTNTALENAEVTYETMGSISVEKNKTDNELSYKLNVTGSENKQIAAATLTYTGISNLSNVETNLLVDIYYTPNAILSSATSSLQNTENNEEKELIILALNKLLTKMYQDTYIETNEFEINEKTIKEQLDEDQINATVSKNEDGTYKIVVNSSGNTYTVDSQGKLIETELSQDSIPTEPKEETIIISLNVKNTNTYGDITEKELNDSNMFKVNDKSLPQLQSLFTQISQRVSNKITETYKDIFASNISSGATVTPLVPTLPDLTQQEIETFNSKFTAYEGDSVTGTRVNTLIQAAIISNQTAISDNTGHYIKITFPDTKGKKQEISVENGKLKYLDEKLSNKVDMGEKYKVSLKYNNDIVSSITVTKN